MALPPVRRSTSDVVERFFSQLFLFTPFLFVSRPELAVDTHWSLHPVLRRKECRHVQCNREIWIFEP